MNEWSLFFKIWVSAFWESHLLENIYGSKCALIVIFVEPFFFFWKELIISITLLCSELWDYIEQLHRLVHSLEARVQQTQDNLEQIRNIMSVWSKVALFERSDGKKDTLLYIEDRSEHVQRRYVQQKMEYFYNWRHSCVLIFRHITENCTCIRYRDISTAGTEIHSLVEQNLKLFGMEQVADSSQWLDYVGYVDNIVSEFLLKTVGCRYVLFYISSTCRWSCETYDKFPYCKDKFKMT